MTWLQRSSARPRVASRAIDAVRQYAVVAARNQITDPRPVIVQQLGPRPSEFNPAERDDHHRIAADLQPDPRAREYREDGRAGSAHWMLSASLLILTIVFVVFLYLSEWALHVQLFAGFMEAHLRWIFATLVSASLVALAHGVRAANGVHARTGLTAAYLCLVVPLGLARAMSILRNKPNGSSPDVLDFAVKGLLFIALVGAVPFGIDRLLQSVRRQSSRLGQEAYAVASERRSRKAARQQQLIEESLRRYDESAEILESHFKEAFVRARDAIERFKNE